MTLCLAAFFVGTESGSTQTGQEIFGQNKVQYHNFIWQYFESENFNTYYYQGGQDIGKFVIQSAEINLETVVKKLDFKLNRKIYILVYNDISDMNQTNIGYNQDETNIGGTTRIVDNKIFVYFNGDHDHLAAQIREGIARIYMNKMLFGVNFQEVLQNAVLLNLPTWFTEGLVSYIGEDWNTDFENRLRDGIMSGKYLKLNKLTEDEARFVGHSIWHYVEETQGTSQVPNLLYMTRINRSLESGFMFVLGGSVSSGLEKWYNFYKDRFAREKTERDVHDDFIEVQKKRKKNWYHYNAKINPNGKYIAYASNHMGRFKVHVRNVSTGEKKVILRGGFKTQILATDFSYPILDWDPSGRFLAVIYEFRDQIKLFKYNVNEEEGETTAITKFQKVFDARFMQDHKNMVFSAMQKGQADIFTYYLPSTRVQQLTNDFYDDLSPAYVENRGRRGILFASNRNSDSLKRARIDTVLPGGDFDLFFYNFNDKERLSRVTKTPLADESQAHYVSDSLFTFLSDANGIRNRYYGYLKSEFSHFENAWFYFDTKNKTKDSMRLNEFQVLDSVIDMTHIQVDSVVQRSVYKDVGQTFPVTNHAFSMREHDLAIPARKVLELYDLNGKQEFRLAQIDTAYDEDSALTIENTEYMNFLEKKYAAEQKAKVPPKKQSEVNEAETNLPDEPEEEPFFQSDFDFIDIELLGADEEVSNQKDPIFKFSKVRPYFVKFSTDQLVTQLNNGLLMTRYQKFNPQNPVFSNPELSALMRLGIKDLMEDHKIYGGFRIPTDFETTEYFLTYENLKKRLDKKFTYYRKSIKDQSFDFVPFSTTPINVADAPLEYNIKTNYLEVAMTYPLDVLKSFRFGASFRNDRYVYKGDNRFSLELPNFSENWLFVRGEFVHDHTIDVALNIKQGFRYKVFVEVHKQIPAREEELFGKVNIPVPNINDQYLAVFGADFRYYQKLHKQITWANRFSYSSSVGTSKLIYYLGGVDSWIAPKFNNETPINTNNNYAFQTLATNLRGFQQNVRNGNSYMLLNSEIRVPVFAYLSHSPIRSEFIKNFQLVPFADIGTAWEGPNPFSQNNPLFTDVFGQDPISVEINYYRNPIVAGYGIGARTMLFGYFIRTDVAWGWDSGEIKGPQWYFSLNMDF